MSEKLNYKDGILVEDHGKVVGKQDITFYERAPNAFEGRVFSYRLVYEDGFVSAVNYCRGEGAKEEYKEALKRGDKIGNAVPQGIHRE